MKVFMQEYGRAVLAAIVGSFCIGICYLYLTNHFFELEENTTEKVVVSAAKEPVIIAPEVIKIDRGDEDYNARENVTNRDSDLYRDIYQKYLSQVTCFENSDVAEKCAEVTVAGIEQVDINTPGRYHLIYRAENKSGRTFYKKVLVIVR